MKTPLVSRFFRRKPVVVSSRSYPYELLIAIFQKLLDPYDCYSSSFLYELPHRVFDTGFFSTKFNRTDLLSAALVCKTWYIAAIDLLYISPRTCSPRHLKLLEKVLKRNPSFSSHVKGLTLIDERDWPIWTSIKHLFFGIELDQKPPLSQSRLSRIHRILKMCPYVDTLSLLRITWFDEEPLPLSSYFPVHIGLHKRLRVLAISDLYVASLASLSIIPGVEFSALEILQLRSIQVRDRPHLEASSIEGPPIQIRFPRLQVLQIAFSPFHDEGIPDTMDITSHAFPQLDTLELHSVWGYPRIEPSCLRQLKKLYVFSHDDQDVPTDWWAGGQLDGIQDLTLPCQFFSSSRVTVLKTLSLPQGLRTLRLLSFSSRRYLYEFCARPPTYPEELQDFKTCADWLWYQQSRFPSNLNMIEVLHCLEKPQPGSEGFDAFLVILNRFEDVCKQHGLMFRTVYRLLDGLNRRDEGEWIVDKEIFP
ncbi:hypothetical protein NLI96_g1509 [Meripilus lineatus]|uniref:F-box domain-containing protein n=1 Tax=Meripilus lineatus TaxID=2056292 RepID=A0AAD5VBZ0_9APHY|nr:hypothetical protein NLI96_g1509 [Physisporinus lineatus]